MTRKQTTASAMFTLFCLAAPIAAHAQIGFTATDRYELSKISAPAHYGSIAAYPVAVFNQGGTLVNSSSGTRSDAGFLVSADLGFKPAKAPTSFEIGGWYWRKGRSDLYQIHARAFVSPDVAIQVGELRSTQVSGHAYTAFLIYEFNSKQIAPDLKRQFGIQIGPGIFNDPTGGKNTTTFSVFVQGSVQLDKNLTLNAGQWYLRDRQVDLTRFTLGLGYGF